MENKQLQQEISPVTGKTKPLARSILSLVFALVFMAMIATFPLLNLFGVTPGINYENRPLAPKPTAEDWIRDYPNAAAKYEDYVNDHFPLKSTLLEWYSLLEYKVFKTSLVPDMTSIGRKDWLFLEGDRARGVIDGQLYTEEQLAEIYQGLMIKYECLKNMGKEYVVYLAPEKQSVYPELYRLPQASYTVAEQLREYLAEKNCPVPFIYGKEYLTEKKALGGQLYYKYDTHWNLLGAQYGYEQVLSEVKKLFPNREIPVATQYDITYAPRGGDLAGTIYLSKHLSEQSPILNYPYAPSYEEVGPIVKVTSAVPSDFKVFLYGDSFAQAGYWSSCFAQTACETRIMHNANGFASLLKNIGDCDVVVEECVQRATYSLSFD